MGEQFTKNVGLEKGEEERRDGGQGTVNRLNHKNSHICFYDILLWRVEAFTFYDCTAIATVKEEEAAGGRRRVEEYGEEV